MDKVLQLMLLEKYELCADSPQNPTNESRICGFFPYISEASTFLYKMIKHNSKPKTLQKWVKMANLWAKPS